ncbi:hypothetical protein KBY24_04665 [Ruegeria pomeroyi]|uniref:Uncharacterized protein n=1 Tax=Ruegeria alba TaxID=2916756 RepID=A0ABS9NXQ9_9RHOB|nr:hypothetical protein [Ruegeria alba]MCE8512410.1 hypothetical protein [Ruegeria pomeroyi]MCE8520938.1 hypothetical protein [Ruegeria pomeroyi]MCE8524541.1 hypothetical protein [Ruegeria pomeroyi]MCE8528917.1 hypothetical protein [Ruegeria pomeroyi]MCE8532665.1 hypothetical protein [Ruegeria pomeroyi]
MTQTLAQKARQNRIAALQHLRLTRQGAEMESEVINLFAHRARQKAKPVFSSVRGQVGETQLAA